LKNIVHKDSLHYLNSLPKRTGKKFENVFPNANPLAIDLIKRMLTFDPSKRITVD
jgi:serine/threonine protein kinase